VDEIFKTKHNSVLGYFNVLICQITCMTIKTEQKVYNNSYFNVSNALNVQLFVLHMHTSIDFQYMTEFALTKHECTASLGLGL
jgi:hypothetical protein